MEAVEGGDSMKEGSAVNVLASHTVVQFQNSFSNAQSSISPAAKSGPPRYVAPTGGRETSLRPIAIVTFNSAIAMSK